MVHGQDLMKCRWPTGYLPHRPSGSGSIRQLFAPSCIYFLRAPQVVIQRRRYRQHMTCQQAVMRKQRTPDQKQTLSLNPIQLQQHRIARLKSRHGPIFQSVVDRLQVNRVK